MISEFDERKREIRRQVEQFIGMLDKIGFTCEAEHELNNADVRFSDDDYNNWEQYLYKLYLKE